MLSHILTDPFVQQWRNRLRQQLPQQLPYKMAPPARPPRPGLRPAGPSQDRKWFPPLVDPGGCAQVAAEVPAPQRGAPQVLGWDPGHR